PPHAGGVGGLLRRAARTRRSGLRGGRGRIVGPTAEEAEGARRRAPARRGHLSADSPLLGGTLTSEGGAEEPRAAEAAFDPHSDPFHIPDADEEQAVEPAPRLLR